IGVAEIVGSTLVYRDGDASLVLKIDSLKLERFAFDEQPRKLRFALAATLGDTPFTVRGAADLQAPSFEGQVEIAGLPLASFAKIAGLELGGTLEAKLDVAVAQLAAGPNLSLSGEASVRSLAVPATRAAAASWNGRVRWQSASGLALDGTLTAQDFSRDTDAGTLAGESLAYRGATTLGAQDALDLRGDLNLVRPSLRGPDLVVDMQTFAATQIQATRARDGTLAVRGGINATSLALDAAGTKLRAAGLDLARLELSVASSGKIAFGGNPVVRDVAFAQGTTSFAAQSLSADATLSRDGSLLQFDCALETALAKFAGDDVEATLAQLRYRGVLVQQGDAISSTGA
ncbi:MAG: DUF748 domain-containing protein, partial [Rhodospirillales bacterium]